MDIKKQLIPAVVAFGVALILLTVGASDANMQRAAIAAVVVGLVCLRPLWGNKILSPRRQLLIVCCGVTAVNVLLLGSGGLQSPWLLLAHLSILMLALFIGPVAAIGFLVAFGATYVAEIIIFPDTWSIITDDPASYFIYALSIIAVTPLAVMLASRYHIKDQLVASFARQVKAASTLIDSIDQLVIMADQSLTILSVNAAVEELLAQPSSALTGQSLSSVLFFRNDGGMVNLTPVESETTLDNLTLLVKNAQPKKIRLTITPIVQLANEPRQYGIVITSANAPATTQVDGFLSTRQAALLEAVRAHLATSDPSLGLYVELAQHISSDRQLLSQLSTPLVSQPQPTDLVQLTKIILTQQQFLASRLGVVTQFDVQDMAASASPLVITRELNISPLDVSSAFYTANVDPNLVSAVISRLIITVLLYSFATTKSPVQVVFAQPDNSSVKLSISTAGQLDTQSMSGLFTPHYAPLPQAKQMAVMSGLEGYLAARVAQEIGLVITPISNGQIVQLDIVINKA